VTTMTKHYAANEWAEDMPARITYEQQWILDSHGNWLLATPITTGEGKTLWDLELIKNE